MKAPNLTDPIVQQRIVAGAIKLLERSQETSSDRPEAMVQLAQALASLAVTCKVPVETAVELLRGYYAAFSFVATLGGATS